MRGPELERYQILGELGQGGMSIVYRARDKQLSREVAVKVLHEFLARQPDARKRFHREAVAVAKLRHPGILEIFDYSGPDAKETYIVTELIEGVTLREFVEKRGRLAYPELGVLVVAELVRALQHAHERSVVHRDLKPENVMITKDGVLKLMDFGLAQLMDGGTRLTATGTLLGSPAHMAPEVIDGKQSDARADLFSMGTILYWLCTGKLPFEAPNPSALFKKILDGKYDDPQMLEPKLGNGVAKIIRKALEPDPEQRYQDVTELYADLKTELDAVGIAPPEVMVRRLLIDPSGFQLEIGPQLVEKLTAAGQLALKEGNVARAMDRFNRVLAIDPDHSEVRALVARLGRRKELQRRARQVAITAVIACGVAAGGYGATLVIPQGEAPKPAEKLIVAPVIAEVAAKTATVAAAKQVEPANVEPANVEPEGAAEAVPRALTTLRTAAGKEKLRRAPTMTIPAPIRETKLADASGQLKATDAIAKGEPKTETSPPPPQPAKAKLKIVVGGALASLVVDGQVREDFNGMRGTVELAPGTHTITVENAQGRHAPKTVEVDASGLIVIVDGATRESSNELRFKVPHPTEDASKIKGWQPR